MKSGKVLISVVVPAYNEEKYIDGCLKALFSQTIPHSEYEVIVVVRNDTTDKTIEICKNYPVKITSSPPGVGMARFLGFEEAKGEILAGTDADTEVAPDWLEVIRRNFSDQEVVSLTGPVYLTDGSPLFARLSYRFAFTFYRTAGKFQRTEVFAGMNFALRKSAYVACGKYDKDIESAEDTDLSYRIAKYGKTKYSSSMKVYTSPRRLQEGYVKSFVRYTNNFILLKLGKKPPGFENYR